MAPHADLAYLDLAALAQALRRRDVSSVEVTRALYERIEALDPRLNSYIRLMRETALAEAEAADQAFAQGEDKGPLQGVPIGVKDLYNTAGVVTAGGMRCLADRVPEQDCTAVARLRQAGAVILGKLTMTEGALSQHHPSIPAPVNPWSEELNFWAGASSSGSGVATAAGLCYAALGSDTGGSIRFPALANGVTGIKPTWGRVSRAGVMALSPSMDHVGPLARDAYAAAAVLQAIAGPDPADTAAAQLTVPDYLKDLDRDLSGLTLGYDPNFGGVTVDAGIRSMLDAAFARLGEAGAELREVRLPAFSEGADAWITICAAETAMVHKDLFPRFGDDYGQALRLFVESGKAFSAIDYAEAEQARLAYRGALQACFQDIDLLLTPLTAQPLLTVDELESFEVTLELFRNLIDFSAPQPLSGFPSIQLPAGLDARRAPQSIQLTASPWNEGLLLRAGAAWQSATSHHRQRPPLAS